MEPADFIITVILPAAVLRAGCAALADDGRTYVHEDGATGRALTCDRCPPGSYMRAHCTETRRTQCAPCPAHHFTQHWNYLPKCLYCSTFCDENQVVERECSPVRNRACACKPGYYRRADFCVRHAECPPGYGVDHPGTADANTQCEKCAPGSYSDRASSSDACARHTDCAALGLRLLLKGNAWRDSLCASCQDLQRGGGLKMLKEILPDFFAHQKVRMHKLVRFVRRSRLVQKEVDRSSQKQLLGHIGRWIQDVGEDKLKSLPGMLRASQLYNVAHKLERMIVAVENAGGCVNSH